MADEIMEGKKVFFVALNIHDELSRAICLEIRGLLKWITLDG